MNLSHRLCDYFAFYRIDDPVKSLFTPNGLVLSMSGTKSIPATRAKRLMAKKPAIN